MAPALFFFSRAVIFKSGVSCRNIGQEQLRVTQSCGAAWINDMYWKKATQMVPKIMEKKGKQ